MLAGSPDVAPHTESPTPAQARDFLPLLKDAALGWMNDNASRLSAALAYYAIFSIAPLLVIIVYIIGLVFGEEAAQGQMAGQISGLVGAQAGETIQTAVAATSNSRGTGLFATIAGMMILLFGASSVFGELKNSLNAIWGVAVKPGRTISTLIRDRFLSFSMVLCIGFLLLISLVISSVVAGLSAYMASALPLPPLIWQFLDFAISLTIVTILFAMIFKILPNVVLSWRDVLSGAFVTALLFTAGKALIAWYLGTNSVASSFGAAGSIVIILLWVYYATTILFFGAEFTKACVLRRQHKIEPNQHAYLLSPTTPKAD